MVGAALVVVGSWVVVGVCVDVGAWVVGTSVVVGATFVCEGSPAGEEDVPRLWATTMEEEGWEEEEGTTDDEGATDEEIGLVLQRLLTPLLRGAGTATGAGTGARAASALW